MAKNDTHFHDVSSEERVLRPMFEDALVYHWEERRPTPGGDQRPARKLRLDKPSAATRFFETVIGFGEKGYVAAAHIVSETLPQLKEREVRSHLLTRMARAIPDCIMRSGPNVREREIAQFGAFMDLLIEEYAETFLEWVEDMNTADPWNDFKLQPTAIIRGALLAPALDLRKCVRFWGLAATSARFPDRMFFDPAEPDAHAMFSAYHLKRYGQLFSVIPEPAVRRFAGAMAAHARTRMRVELSTDGRDRRSIVVVEVTERERRSAFESIITECDDVLRRALLREILLPPIAA